MLIVGELMLGQNIIKVQVFSLFIRDLGRAGHRVDDSPVYRCRDEI